MITCKLENRLKKICPPKGSKLDNLGKKVEKATLPEPVRVENGAFMWMSVSRNVCNGRRKTCVLNEVKRRRKVFELSVSWPGLFYVRKV